MIISPDNIRRGYAESDDSTHKMLIYQIPFSEVKDMSVLLKNLENSISNHCSIDIENNSLEDAYINIAKEEERLIKEMNENTNNSVSVR